MAADPTGPPRTRDKAVRHLRRGAAGGHYRAPHNKKCPHKAGIFQRRTDQPSGGVLGGTRRLEPVASKAAAKVSSAESL